MPTTSPLRTRRLTAGAALVALPLAAVAGCGSAAAQKKDSTQTTLQKASDNLSRSGATSVVMRFEDPSGSLKKSATTGDDASTPAQADLLLGGTLSLTVDPAGTSTMHDLQTADPAAPVADQLKRVNLAMSVQADGGPLVQVRIVAGDLYANVSVDRLAGVVSKSGSSSDVKGSLDGLAAEAPTQLGPLVTDLEAGKWLKLPLAPLGAQLQQLTASATPTPSADPQLGADLLAAVKPFVTVNDASGSGGDRVLDVTVQAKQALKAALTAIKASEPDVPGLSELETTQLDKLGDGAAKGTVTVTDDHLKKISLDLASVGALLPPDGTAAPDLTGARVTLDVDDSADEVTVPDDVSSADLGSLVQQGLANLPGGLGRTATS